MLSSLTRLKWAFYSLLLGILVAIVLEGSSSVERARKDINAAFHAGQPFVLVVAGNGEKTADTDEAYADWAEYLNAFRAKTGSRLHIIKVTDLQYTEIIAEPKLKDQYGTLFVRDAEHVLLYGGMILEPQVYRLGLAYLQGHPDEKADTVNGFKETVFRRTTR